ncbi:hypothetical protein K439DRAFT_1618796 [Ramaria rubella]|nr:hypothetical protein K439DRAFT_1618796 [Ramaria rubella]
MKLHSKQWVAPQSTGATRARGHGTQGGQGGQYAPATNDPAVASLSNLGRWAIDQESAVTAHHKEYPQTFPNTSVTIRLPEKVSIATSGNIMMTPSGKPMRTEQFKHACVEKTSGQLQPQPHAHFASSPSHSSFGCVAIHYALEVETLPNGTARPWLDFKTYNMHYTTYMDSLQAFAVSHLDESLAVQKFLWNSGRVHASIPLEAIGNDVSFDESLSEEEFEWLMAASMSGSQVGMVAAAAQVAQQG